VKGSITGLMLSAPPAVRAQLSEALTIVSAHDFPAAWPALLPDLVSRLRGADAGEVRSVLETANAIFKRYRNQFMTDALSAELQYSQQLVEPLLAVLRRLTAQARAPARPSARAPHQAAACGVCVQGSCGTQCIQCVLRVEPCSAC
jgi:exportin-2 (importin alpha re-exporter)